MKIFTHSQTHFQFAQANVKTKNSKELVYLPRLFASSKNEIRTVLNLQ